MKGVATILKDAVYILLVVACGFLLVMLLTRIYKHTELPQQ